MPKKGQGKKGGYRHHIAAVAREGVEGLAYLVLRRLRRGWQATAPLAALPKPLKGGDPQSGETLLAGHFTVAGQTIEQALDAALAAPIASYDWADELHGFAWLGHLAACNKPQAGELARRLIDHWAILSPRRAHWTMVLARRRLLAVLFNATLLLGNADRDFYARFRQMMADHVAFLRNGLTLGLAPNGREEMMVIAAVLLAHLVIEPMPQSLERYGKRLERALAWQIHGDGGHVSRNPQALLDLLTVLLPLRALYVDRAIPPPSGLLLAIERMLPMLRFFQHRDGTLALMNGMGPTDRDTLANIFAADDVKGRPALEAQSSGYQRIEGPDFALIFDCGLPPPHREAEEAHAGTLAFEFSSDGERLIVNCGIPTYQRAPWRHFTRRTSAHSTLAIDDRPSSMIARVGENEFLFPGPTHVPVMRVRESDTTMVSASHDGYGQEFGLIHQRTLWLSHDGRRLDGEDRLEAAAGYKSRRSAPLTLRFHLHPDIDPSLTESNDTLLLRTAKGAYWAFRVPNHQIAVEESAFLGAVGRPPRTRQLVVNSHSMPELALVWFLVLLRPAP